MVISKSIDKCNESVGHCSWYWVYAPFMCVDKQIHFGQKKFLRQDFFENLAKGDTDLAVSGWDGSWNISSLGTPQAQQAKSLHPMPDSS